MRSGRSTLRQTLKIDDSSQTESLYSKTHSGEPSPARPGGAFLLPEICWDVRLLNRRILGLWSTRTFLVHRELGRPRLADSKPVLWLVPKSRKIHENHLSPPCAIGMMLATLRDLACDPQFVWKEMKERLKRVTSQRVVTNICKGALGWNENFQR